MDQFKIQKLEKRLGYEFKNRNELYRALTHSTFSKEEKEKKGGARLCPHQGTYATLGDAILKAVFIWVLMEKGLKTKGDITIFKAGLEKNLKLAEVGKRLCLLEDNLILHRMGDGEQLEKGSKKLCADTVEALVGAIFVDTGHSLPETKICISKIFALELDGLERKYLK
nr:ribonuclease III domain-containing protein [uncultured Methanoregula sp.]